MKWPQQGSPYAQANKTGRTLFWYGIVLVVAGLLLLLHAPIAPMAGVAVAAGLHFISMMSYDPRCKTEADR